MSSRALILDFFGSKTVKNMVLLFISHRETAAWMDYNSLCLSLSVSLPPSEHKSFNTSHSTWMTTVASFPLKVIQVSNSSFSKSKHKWT
jgi:hypothetical protein